MTQSPHTGELVARDIYEVANQLQSYVGPDTPEPLAAFLMREGAEAAKLADAITTLERKLEEERALSKRLKLEAQGHAMEARTANSTIYEIYQVLSGGRGEPGNWNGAEPARQYVTASQAEVERLKAALKFCQSVLAMMTAPDAIRSTSVMHAWTHAVEAEATARAALESSP